MVRLPIKPNVYGRKITKGRGQETTTTTVESLTMIITSNYKEEKNSTVGGGKHRISIKTHGKISRRIHKEHTEKIKTKEGNTKYKG